MKKKKPTARAAVRSKPSRGKAVKATPAAKARAAVAPRKAATAAPVEAAVAAPPAADAFYLKLDASCTLRETADLQFSLVVANGDPVVVDGSGVERIDTAGLQLLVALARRQRQAGRRMEWKAVSPELRKCGERLGLVDALGFAAAGELP